MVCSRQRDRFQVSQSSDPEQKQKKTPKKVKENANTHFSAILIETNTIWKNMSDTGKKEQDWK